MKSNQKKQAAGVRRATARRSTIARWVAAAAVLGVVGYGLSQLSNIAYDEGDIAVVDFSDLASGEKRTALEAANTSRCTCGCGMSLAECVATDSTCPLRVGNIDRIKTMVQQAKGS